LLGLFQALKGELKGEWLHEIRIDRNFEPLSYLTLPGNGNFLDVEWATDGVLVRSVTGSGDWQTLPWREAKLSAKGKRKLELEQQKKENMNNTQENKETNSAAQGI
jgi:hypothetical protein